MGPSSSADWLEVLTCSYELGNSAKLQTYIICMQYTVCIYNYTSKSFDFDKCKDGSIWSTMPMSWSHLHAEAPNTHTQFARECLKHVETNHPHYP